MVVAVGNLDCSLLQLVVGLENYVLSTSSTNRRSSPRVLQPRPFVNQEEVKES